MAKTSAADGEKETAVAALVAATNEHSEATMLFHAAVAQQMDLDPTAYKALFALKRLGPLSAGELSRETGLTPASVTDLIDRLVGRGYAVRTADTADRRRILVSLNEATVAGARSEFAKPNPSLAKLARGYSASEIKLISDFLEKNAARLRHDLATLGKSGPRTI